MIEYRSFRNSDPPGLAEIWRSQRPQHNLAQPVTAALLETLVFAKPFFDPQGLLLATENGRLLGFVHAGFGPDERFSALDYQLGVSCLVMVTPDADRETIGRELLARAENYLRSQGAKVLYGGGIHPLNPFYLGLYGGVELPGVLGSDEFACELFRANGYKEIDRVVILERTLASFRPPVDRQQMSVRRSCRMEIAGEPPPANWWEACVWGQATRQKFVLTDREGNVCSTATYWDLEPLATCWGVRAQGLFALETQPRCRRQGMAAFLVAESMKQLAAEGTSIVQVQTMQGNEAALKLYAKLGFSTTEQGLVFRKE